MATAAAAKQKQKERQRQQRQLQQTGRIIVALAVHTYCFKMNLYVDQLATLGEHLVASSVLTPSSAMDCRTANSLPLSFAFRRASCAMRTSFFRICVVTAVLLLLLFLAPSDATAAAAGFCSVTEAVASLVSSSPPEGFFSETASVASGTASKSISSPSLSRTSRARNSRTALATRLTCVDAEEPRRSWFEMLKTSDRFDPAEVVRKAARTPKRWHKAWKPDCRQSTGSRTCTSADRPVPRLLGQDVRKPRRLFHAKVFALSLSESSSAASAEQRA
mmetsp:Transcript_36529/g.72227  ORF Transcript_36529/g.72227 Transcript_36529/m.72227 type:complete len:276 (-) Transcript_36529:1720-2547(-)